MPRPNPPYTEEFKQRIVELINSGRSIRTVSEEFKVSQQTVRNWVKQTALDSGKRTDGLTTAERDELTRLRREVKVLREEKDILKKAAAWFAQENGTTRSKGSSS
jgi:transposase